MPGTTHSKPVQILIIEDNTDHWVLIEKAIGTCFAEALTARVASVEKALELVDGYCMEEWAMPKLILLDLYLPTLEDGLSLVKHLKTIAHCRAIPIVALSASNRQSDIAKAYQSGVSSYCLKPGRFNDWVMLVESLRNYWVETATLPPTYYSVF